MYNFLLVVICLAFVSCANQVAPTGGDKDVTPPKLTRVTPENGTTNFQYKAITFEFDEFVDIRLPAPTFSITPDWPEEPSVSVKKRVVTISVPDSLLDNTTYTINFGRSLKDINEGNVLEDLTYAFSTGPTIDSLQLTGKLILANTGEPASSLMIGLFVQQRDSILLYTKPLYSTKSNQEGAFAFQYLPQKPFYLLAWDDVNNDRKISYGELFGFIDTMVVPTAEPSDISMLIGTVWQGKRKPELYTIHNRRFLLTPFNDNWTVAFDSSTGITADQRTDSMLLHLPYNLKDTISIAVQTTDTVRHYVLRPRFGKDVTDKFDFPVPTLQLADGKPKVLFSFNSPIVTRTIEDTMVKVYTDTSLNGTFVAEAHSLQFTPSKEVWGDTITFLFREGSITNALGQSSSPDTSRIILPAQDGLGSATIVIDSVYQRSPHIISLIDNKDQRVLHCTSCPEIVASTLMPGNYHIEIIADRNNNGKWDGGDFYAGLQPETRTLRRDVVQIKANWDISISLKP